MIEAKDAEMGNSYADHRLGQLKNLLDRTKDTAFATLPTVVGKKLLPSEIKAHHDLVEKVRSFAAFSMFSALSDLGYGEQASKLIFKANTPSETPAQK